MARTFSLKLQFPKDNMIITNENRNIPSINKLSWDAIWNSLILLQVFLGSIHDSRMLGHAALYQRANSNEVLLESKVNINRHQVGPMLVGSGINPLSKRLPEPYIFNPTVSARERITYGCISSNKHSRHFFDFEAWSCSAYWMAVLKQGRCFFEI